MFIKNADVLPVQYIASRQKEIIGLIKKSIFKVVTVKDILSYAQIFNSYFGDKLKHMDTNKVYKKSWLII